MILYLFPFILFKRRHKNDNYFVFSSMNSKRTNLLNLVLKILLREQKEEHPKSIQIFVRIYIFSYFFILIISYITLSLLQIISIIIWNLTLNLKKKYIASDASELLMKLVFIIFAGIFIRPQKFSNNQCIMIS